MEQSPREGKGDAWDRADSQAQGSRTGLAQTLKSKSSYLNDGGPSPQGGSFSENWFRPSYGTVLLSFLFANSQLPPVRSFLN